MQSGQLWQALATSSSQSVAQFCLHRRQCAGVFQAAHVRCVPSVTKSGCSCCCSGPAQGIIDPAL